MKNYNQQNLPPEEQQLSKKNNTTTVRWIFWFLFWIVCDQGIPALLHIYGITIYGLFDQYFFVFQILTILFLLINGLFFFESRFWQGIKTRFGSFVVPFFLSGTIYAILLNAMTKNPEIIIDILMLFSILIGLYSEKGNLKRNGIFKTLLMFFALVLFLILGIAIKTKLEHNPLIVKIIIWGMIVIFIWAAGIVLFEKIRKKPDQKYQEKRLE